MQRVMQDGLVASTRREANEIGEAVFASGGNAVDAAVAASFAIGVAEPYMGGIGGVGEIVIAEADGSVHVVDCAARAPKAAQAGMFEIVGDATGLYAWPAVAGDRNVYGALAVTPPQLVQGLKTAHERFGRLPWSEIVRPAADLARAGIAVDHFTAAIVAHEMATLARDHLARALYYPEGYPIRPPLDGNPERVRNPKLAATLDLIADQGAAPFQPGGVLATAILEAVAAGGILSAADFEAPRDRLVGNVAPLTTFRGWRIHGSPRPSGSMTVAAILDRLAGAGRFASASDPGRFAAIADASLEAFDARLERGPEARFGGGNAAGRTPTATTHVSAIGGDGMSVSVTQTLLSLFGAQVGVAEHGFFLNNGMMWFDPRPGHTASIGPRARAMMAVSPMIAIDDRGGRRISVGALGARRIITAVAQVLDMAITYEGTIATAVNWPRVHADGVGRILVDHRLPPQVTTRLEAECGPAEPAYYGPTSLNFARASAVSLNSAAGRLDKGIDERARAVWHLGEDFP